MMNISKKPAVSQSELKRLLKYTPDGRFIWLVDRGPVKAGDVAGGLSRGYTTIGVNGRRYFAHVLVWLYVHGEMPKSMLDHRDTNKQNNRIENLRLSNHSLNGLNVRESRPSKKSNKWLGAFPFKNRFVAFICVNRRQINLGYFDTPEEAHLMYLLAKVQVHPEFFYEQV